MSRPRTHPRQVTRHGAGPAHDGQVSTPPDPRALLRSRSYLRLLVIAAARIAPAAPEGAAPEGAAPVQAAPAAAAGPAPVPRS